ncbi:MAG: hypothetical protein HY275_08545 [Gemmatimonadetes bacterium]|nr:hypothetical protein [Gemmatimonadota bacterium]
MHLRVTRPYARFALGLAALLAACGPARPATPPAPVPSAQLPARPWPVKTREHVDLWLHGFAMLTEDDAKVPLFARGYRDAMTVAKNSRQLLTKLDEQRVTLARSYKLSPSYQGAQFAALYFGSVNELMTAANLAITMDGDPRKATTREAQAIFTLFGAWFPNQADRAWFKQFVEALTDEQARFYHDWWTAQQRERVPALAAAESTWLALRPRIQQFLSGTKQPTGDLLLSLPLAGEGRTVKEGNQEVIAVGFPATRAQAAEASFTFVHEVVAAVADAQVADQTSPAEKRNGVAEKMTAMATVRGGALLLAAAAPELVADYQRFYLRAAGITPPAGNPAALFEASFPVPDAVREGIRKQVEILLGGI